MVCKHCTISRGIKVITCGCCNKKKHNYVNGTNICEECSDKLGKCQICGCYADYYTINNITKIASDIVNEDVGKIINKKCNEKAQLIFIGFLETKEDEVWLNNTYLEVLKNHPLVYEVNPIISFIGKYKIRRKYGKRFCKEK